MANVHDKYEQFYLEQVRYAKEERERRKDGPVVVRAEDYLPQLSDAKPNIPVFLVDPRLGFSNRTHRFWINRLPPGGEEGQVWKTIGHRHTVEAVIYWLTGKGYSLISGKRYDWKAGDVVCVPTFAWHRHINTSDEPALYVASTTGPMLMAVGQAIYEDERYPQFFVFAQQGAETMEAWTPGGAGKALDADEEAQTTRAGRLYAQQVSFALDEEARRKESRVIIKAEEITFERTPIGNIAYLVDPRLGFRTHSLATLMAEIPPGKRSGAHRHLYDEIDYVMEGQGKVVVEDQTYEIKRGDAVAVPVFAWHQYFNTGSQALRFLSHSTRPAMENLGIVLTHHGENADY